MFNSTNQNFIANRIGKEFVEKFDFYGWISHQLVVKCVFGISRKFTSAKIFRFLGIKSEISQFGSLFCFSEWIFIVFIRKNVKFLALIVSLQLLLPSIFVELKFYKQTFTGKISVNNRVILGVYSLV